MICEKLDLQFDLEKVRDEFTRLSEVHHPVMVSPHFGGWSLTSSNGEYTDGWLKSRDLQSNKIDDNFDILNFQKSHNIKPPHKYIVPTQMCESASMLLIQYLRSLDLSPCRVRYMLLKAGGASNLHRDAPNHVYAVRLHIPLFTNEFCFFECEEGKVHLSKDSFYMLKVNRPHRVYNNGHSDRVHIVCDIYDKKGVSLHHKITPEQSEYFKKLYYPDT